MIAMPMSDDDLFDGGIVILQGLLQSCDVLWDIWTSCVNENLTETYIKAIITTTQA